MRLTVAIPVVLAAVCLAGGANAQHVTRPAAKPPASRPMRPERPPQKPAGEGPGSVENLKRLLKLSPEQRKKALEELPPARREVIEKRLNDYQKMPEPERAKAFDRLSRMQSLPPQKQQQVRASVQKLTALPQPRHGVVQRQINQMKVLSDADRSAVMNSEEFRSKFTPSEQQIIEDICLVTPRS
jgi:hypothetical protein